MNCIEHHNLADQMYRYGIATQHTECAQCGSDINPEDTQHTRLIDGYRFCNRCCEVVGIFTPIGPHEYIAVPERKPATPINTAHTDRTDNGHITVTIDGIPWVPDDYSADTWYAQSPITAVVQLIYGEGYYFSVRDSTTNHSIEQSGAEFLNLFDALGATTAVIVKLQAQHP